MKFDVAAIKKVLTEAGHVVSEGEQMLAKDMQELVIWSRLHFNLSEAAIHYGMAYPALLPKEFPGHPDAQPATAQADASPVQAPQETVQPVAPTPEPALEPVASAPTEQPAEEAQAAEQKPAESAESEPAQEEKAAEEKPAE